MDWGAVERIAIGRAAKAPGSLSPLERLRRSLGQSQILLVLDNYEHLLAEPDAVGLVSDLLTGVPGLRIMVTSREPLDLRSTLVNCRSRLRFSVGTIFSRRSS